jgi:hypothetical protein
LAADADSDAGFPVPGDSKLGNPAGDDFKDFVSAPLIAKYSLF